MKTIIEFWLSNYAFMAADPFIVSRYEITGDNTAITLSTLWGEDEGWQEMVEEIEEIGSLDIVSEESTDEYIMTIQSCELETQQQEFVINTFSNFLNKHNLTMTFISQRKEDSVEDD